MTGILLLRRMAHTPAACLMACLLAAAGGAANAAAFLGKQFETRYFDVSGSAQMCDIFNTADYQNCALTRQEDFSRTISLSRTFDVGWDPARGQLNSIKMFWAPVDLGQGVGLGPIADFKAAAAAGKYDLRGWLDVNTDFRFAIEVPDGTGGTALAAINHVNIGDALDSCTPTQILFFVQSECTLSEQQGIDLSNVSATYPIGAGASIGDFFIGDAGDPTVMMTMDYSATFHFWAEDLHNNNLYTVARSAEINVAGRFAIRYGYSPSAPPRGGPPGGPPDPEPGDPTAVPVPPSVLMMAAGLAGAAIYARRRSPKAPGAAT